MTGIIILIMGLLIGSFLNVCIYRIPREESIAFPPSHCMKCGNKIKPYDLIPILSYLFLKGKCRNCGEKISVRYPLIELATGIIFFAIYLKFGLSIKLFKYLFFACFLIVIGMIDYDTTDVYNIVTKSGIFVGAVFLVISYFYKENIITYLIGAALGAAAIALIILSGKLLISLGYFSDNAEGDVEEEVEASQDVMGWGDFDICLFCGLFLGFKLTLLMLFLSTIIGALVGVSLILLKKKSRRDYIPFGPSIVTASFIALIFGNQIISMYFNIL